MEGNKDMPARQNEFKAAIFDWAGTMVDHGSRAPVEAVIEIFRRRGIEITDAEARGPMGSAKRDHIATIAALPRVSALWRERQRREPGDDDVQRMYEEFLPLQKEVLAGSGSEVIPGVPEAVAMLRRLGLSIGSTTGYTRELMDVVAPIAAGGGFAPDVIVCSDDVSAGRPAPWMNVRAAERLGVYPMSSVIVVDDTPLGVKAGRNAGAVTIAVSRTGNALGLSLSELHKLPSNELQGRLKDIESQFLADGAHLVVESVADLPNRWHDLVSIARSV